jgi:esterase
VRAAQEMANDVVHWVDSQLGVREISIIGHSMGGKVAMEIALRHADRVANLVVVDISPVPYSGTLMHTAIIDQMAGMDLSALQSASEAREAMKAVIPDPTTREFVLTNLVSDPNSKGYKWKVNIQALRRGLLSGDLAGFTPAPAASFGGPCLWIKGGNSAYIQPEAHSGHMRELFPAHELQTIAGAGHWPHAENPEVGFRARPTPLTPVTPVCAYTRARSCVCVCVCICAVGGAECS